LKDFVHRGCAPPDIPSSRHAFVHTTNNGSWTPTLHSAILPARSQVKYYQYEIFAPDGILVHYILRGYASKKEVCFHGVISPKYIRSCLVNTATPPPHEANYHAI